MAKAQNKIDRDLLKTLLSYDPQTGLFSWKVKRGKSGIGKVAGTINANGRCYIVIRGKSFLRSRLAWFYEFGWWPEEIDHINRNRQDDRIENLRSCTKRQNEMNKGCPPQSRSGIKGLAWRPEYQTWQVRIKKGMGVTKTVGSFACMCAALKAYKKAEAKYYGEFAPR